MRVVKGFHLQVHYYEAGNVQLVSSKGAKETVKTSVRFCQWKYMHLNSLCVYFAFIVQSEEATAKEIVQVLASAESLYQVYICK